MGPGQINLVVPARPALFSVNSTGFGPGAILNRDGTAISAANPATPGSIVVLFATTEGQTSPGGRDGVIAGDSPPKPALPVSVDIGGRLARVPYAGAVPLSVAGLLQVNAEVPTDSPSGAAVFPTA
ncbi:MAG: hypothetical protein Q8N47_02955 [Bryobacterales bacterium]|nr:hypothetical protein [Bryobacterales bacterium]